MALGAAKSLVQLSESGVTMRLYSHGFEEPAVGYKVSCRVYGGGIASDGYDSTDVSAARAATRTAEKVDDDRIPSHVYDIATVFAEAILQAE